MMKHSHKTVAKLDRPCIIFDLDHTLVHSVDTASVTSLNDRKTYEHFRRVGRALKIKFKWNGEDKGKPELLSANKPEDVNGTKFNMTCFLALPPKISDTKIVDPTRNPFFEELVKFADLYV